MTSRAYVGNSGCMSLIRVVTALLASAATTIAMPSAADEINTKFFEEFKTRAEAGDVRAYAMVAAYYMNGMGTPRNVEAAMVWLQKGVAQNDFGSMKLLSSVYLNGVGGIPCDPTKARHWAQRAAQSGDPESQYMFYRARILEKGSPPKPARSECDYGPRAFDVIEDPETDVAAYESLFSAANKGIQDAQVLLVDFFADRVGIANRRKALQVLEKIRGNDARLPYPLQSKKDSIQQLENAGTTYASPSLVKSVTSDIAQKLKSEGKDFGACKSAPQLVHADVIKGIVGSKYLHTRISELNESHLLRGAWEEAWVIDTCGTQSKHQVRFDADGS